MNRTTTTQDLELQQSEFAQPPQPSLAAKAEDHSSRGRERARAGGREAPAAVRSRDTIQYCREFLTTLMFRFKTG